MDDGDSEVDAATRLGSHLINIIFSSLPSDIPVIQSLVKAGAPLWYQDEAHGFSALHAACFVENHELVQMLIESGAVWNSGSCISLYLPVSMSRITIHGQSMIWATQRVI
jgi:type IV protein arginine methyltransferase